MLRACTPGKGYPVYHTIAVLEDDDRRAEAMRCFVGAHLPHRAALFFDNAPDMVAWLGHSLPSVHLLCLDHDLGPNRRRGGVTFDPGLGRDVADTLAGREPVCPVLIHSTNALGAAGMQRVLERAGWRVERVVPFDDLAWVATAWGEAVERLLQAGAAA